MQRIQQQHPYKIIQIAFGRWTVSSVSTQEAHTKSQRKTNQPRSQEIMQNINRMKKS